MADGGERVYHRGAHGVESSRKGYGHLRDDTQDKFSSWSENQSRDIDDD